MTTKPVVSVVIRAFNCERYIKKAIESILAQTFQSFEVVIVNDSSSDRTEEILQNYAQQDTRIKVITNRTNQGPVKTMNISLQHAQGEFIAVQDADDMSLPHRLETQVEFLKTHPNVALTGGGAQFIDEEGELLRVRTAEQMSGVKVRQFLETGQSFIHSSVMYRKECIEAIGLYDEFFLYAHDYDMLIRMADTFDIVYLNKPVVKWRRLNSGITGTKKQAQSAFAELARMSSKSRKNGTALDLKREYDQLIAAGESESGVQLKQSSSDAQYYYTVGLQLLEQRNNQMARQRFLQSLKCKGDISIFLRALVFWGLSFFPNGVIHSTPVRALRRTF